MFIVSNLISALAAGVDIFLSILTFLIFVRVLVSWVSPDPYNPIVLFLSKTTDPVLNPIRRFLPDWPIDVSPIIACILIILLRSFLVSTLGDLAAVLR